MSQRRLSRFPFIAALAAIWASHGCGTFKSQRPLHDDNPPGTWHVVQAGETSVKIAKEAGIPLDDLLEINGLRRDENLVPGRLVYVLSAHPGQPSAAAGSAGPSLDTGLVAQPTAASAPLRWPVASPQVSSTFGLRWGREHEGIDMRAPTGTPVFAAAGGDVLYAGDQVRGYGNMVVISHGNDLVTVYAHNSVVLVRTGDPVKVGQEIARVGESGRATAPHLHFEVRRGEIPKDPLQFLPPLK